MVVVSSIAASSPSYRCENHLFRLGLGFADFLLRILRLCLKKPNCSSRISHIRFAIPIMHILAHYEVDLSRDIQVPVKKTCYIKDTKLTRIGYCEEGAALQNLDIVVTEEEESQNETLAESSSQAGEGTSRASDRAPRR
ncbi:unnamed protein product [Cuscuta campestris]|uniref:Uncharacterized protein n=1 Tax=Cuscuta campestris TaxID=132261 RepID=A0A484M1G0_9ASTE|nr:unnamed protein product [Cuscuta campestris]